MRRRRRPSPEAITVREHHSFVAAARRRVTSRARFDPRAGFFGIELHRLRRADRRADRAALHRAATGCEKKDPVGRGERAGRADRVLRRPRRARADPLGAARRRALVEPGVRGGRLSQRLPRRADARGRRSDGRALQHDQWVHRSTRGWSYGSVGDRSAHRRDHQGPRHARLAARAAGLSDRRGPARAVHDRRPETPHELRAMVARRGCASSPRTRWATRSASRTTTRRAPRAAPR